MVAAVVQDGRPDSGQRLGQPLPARLAGLAVPGTQRDQTTLSTAVPTLIGPHLADYAI
jgi:hypothetical protein